MLLTQKSFTEAARALALWVGMLIDESHRHPDPAKREAADDLIQMLTPIIKAYFTDMGSECANQAVQVFGGHGFIRENGVEHRWCATRASPSSTRAPTASRRSTW